MLAELLRVLYETLPRHDFYLKVDADTMLLPANLLVFLDTFARHSDPVAPAYFGSNEVSYKHLKWDGCSTAACRSLEYAQGGAEGFTRAALKRVVEDRCILRIGETPCRSKACLHKIEDVTLGVCMQHVEVLGPSLAPSPHAHA